MDRLAQDFESFRRRVYGLIGLKAQSSSAIDIFQNIVNKETLVWGESDLSCGRAIKLRVRFPSALKKTGEKSIKSSDRRKLIVSIIEMSAVDIGKGVEGESTLE